MPDVSQIYEGCFEISDGLRLADIWQSIHSNAFEWEHVPKNTNFFKLRKIIDDADDEIYANLNQVPIDRWIDLCGALGWTGYGAVAASWCDGASQDVIWDIFQKIPYTLDHSKTTMRMVDRINRAVITEITELRSLVIQTKNKTKLIALQLMIARITIEINLTENELAFAHEDLQRMISEIQKSKI